MDNSSLDSTIVTANTSTPEQLDEPFAKTVSKDDISASDSEDLSSASDSEDDTSSSSEDDSSDSGSEDGSSAEDDDATEPPKKKAKLARWKRGDYIIAAWAVYDNWFPGVVSKVISDEMAIITYFARSQNEDNIFVWPRDSDIQTTHASQVLAHEVDMSPSANLRSYQLNVDINKINQKFTAFCNSS